MRAQWTVWVAVACLLAGCQQNERGGNEERVSIEDVPPAARAALERETGGELTHVEREDEGGQAVYEAEYTKGGKTWSVEVDENGNVLENEVDDDEDDD